jgi:putative ABC transport system permease protein
LRVLGLSVRETGGILLYESLILSIAGIAVGLPLGRGLCRLMVYAYDTELYRLPFHIEPESHAAAALAALVFALLANAFIWRKVRRLDMVQVLKERE